MCYRGVKSTKKIRLVMPEEWENTELPGLAAYCRVMVIKAQKVCATCWRPHKGGRRRCKRCCRLDVPDELYLRSDNAEEDDDDRAALSVTNMEPDIGNEAQGAN